MTSIETILAKHETLLEEHEKLLDKHHNHMLRVECKIDKLYLAMLGLLGGIVTSITMELINHLQ